MKKNQIFLLVIVSLLFSCVTPRNTFLYSAKGNIGNDSVRNIEEEFPDVKPQYQAGDKVYLFNRAGRIVIKLNGGPWLGKNFYTVFKVDTIKN